MRTLRGLCWLGFGTLCGLVGILSETEVVDEVAHVPVVLNATFTAPEPRAILLAAMGCVGLMIFGWFKQKRA